MIKSIVKNSLIIAIICIILTDNVLHLEEWEKDAYRINAKVAVENGGSCTVNVADGRGSISIVENGVIVNRDFLYECGVTDAEISQWQATAQTNNTSTIANDNNILKKNNNTSSDASEKQASTKSTYTEEEIEAAWEETNRVESTCTEAGYIEYTNSLTNETKTEELELAEHSYEEIERIEPTCIEDGSVTYTCLVCGDTYTETLPTTGHIYEWTTTKELGLFTEGLEEEICSVCGEKSGATHTLSAQSPIPFVGVIGIIVVVCGGITGFVIYKKKKNR